MSLFPKSASRNFVPAPFVLKEKLSSSYKVHMDCYIGIKFCVTSRCWRSFIVNQRLHHNQTRYKRLVSLLWAQIASMPGLPTITHPFFSAYLYPRFLHLFSDTIFYDYRFMKNGKIKEKKY